MRASIQSYLLAEALRYLEEEAATPQSVPDIDKQAIAAGATFADRILVRAANLAAATGLVSAVRQAGRRLRFIVMALLVLCFGIGVGVTHALPEGLPASANVVSLLAVLLLPNLVSLLLWLGLSIAALLQRSGQKASGWLGEQSLALYTLLERRLQADSNRRAAGRAWRGFLTGTSAGRLRLMLISQLCWTSLLIGALTGCWWLLVIRQVDFVWGSTLLTTADVQSLLGSLTRWVSAFGFTVPSADDIAVSRLGTLVSDPDLRRRWGIFVLGALISLALLPRLFACLLNILSISRWS